MSSSTRSGDRRAGAGGVHGRRPDHLRGRELGGQPPLGGQQPDHQRRDALAARRRHLLRRRRRRHGGRHGQPHRDAGHRRAGRRQRAGRPRRRAGRGRRAADRARSRRAPATGTPSRRRPRSRCSRDFAPALGQAFGEARDRGELLFGFAEHAMAHHLPRQLHRPAAAARPAHRPGRAQRQEPRLRPLGLGRRRHPRLPRRLGAPTSPPTSQRKMAWSQRRVELPAGRYETLLPPSAVSDLMIYLYWTMEARDADEGRNVFAKPGGGNRVGERLAALPLTLRSDPCAPGLETAPFQVVGASSGSASVFDNGMATPGGELDRGRHADQPDPAARLGAEDDGPGDGRRRQPDPRGPDGDGVARRDGRRHRARPAADHASGTSARSTRRRCC